MGDGGETFRGDVADAFRPVHRALDEALATLAEKGITGRTYFNAEEGLLIIWFEGPKPEPGGGETHEKGGEPGPKEPGSRGEAPDSGTNQI